MHRMHPDEDSQTTLSKWPFILGDGLLVAMALAIAVLGDWQSGQLGHWQVASCVMAVALGAALYVLPYIVEFRVRTAERAQDRSAEVQVLLRQVKALDGALDALETRLDALAAGRGEEGTSIAEKELMDRVDAKLEASAAKQAKLVADLEEVRNTCRESIAHDDKSSLETEAPKGLDTRPPEKPQREQAPSVERLKREPRKRHQPDGKGLLKRAIKENPDGSASAVTRIIESESGPRADGPKESGLLFDAGPSPVPVQKKRLKKNDTVLTASIFIGIGNKPFVRGSGAGLSWDAGQPMEFQEIGKWRWVAPEGLATTVEFQLYRNDEDPDLSGKYTLDPGQRVEIEPVFD